MQRLFDRVLFHILTRRLALFRPGGSDRFADGLMRVLSQEMARRDRLYVGWGAQLRVREAMRQFSDFRPDERARLQ